MGSHLETTGEARVTMWPLAGPHALPVPSILTERLRAFAAIDTWAPETSSPEVARALLEAARTIEAQHELLVRVVREAREDREGFAIAAEAVEQCMEQVERIVDRVRDRNLALAAELAAVRADWTSERASRARARLRS